MADTTEAPAAADAAVDSSIAEHEAAFMEGPTPAPKAEAELSEPAAEPSSRTRDKSGKFLSKSRTPEPAEPVTRSEPPAEPVETLETLRERLRARDAELEALKRAPRTPEPPATVRPAEPAAAEPVAPRAGKFPKFEEWAALKGNETKDFDDFLDEREEHSYQIRREQERADEAAKTATETFQKLVTAYSEQLPAVLKKYPDFQTVMNADRERVKVSKVVERAVLEVGPEIAYYLVTHDQERRELSDESLVDPENPAFPSAVAAMKRYLKTLIAAEPPAAEPKPVATRPTLVPRPPSPTKTGGMPPSDEPPEDDASIASHEAYYGPKKGHR